MVYNLRYLIPKTFLKIFVKPDYNFNISHPWWSCFDMVELLNGKYRKIEPSAYCEYYLNGSYVSILISIKKAPKLTNAIMKIGQLPQVGKRESKYLDLYKVYEGFQKSKLPYHSALRHSLSHSTQVLNHSSTINAMKELFGSVEIDLNKYTHQKIFWELFSELLINVDLIIGSLIVDNLEEYKMSNQFRRPITNSLAEWEKIKPE